MSLHEMDMEIYRPGKRNSNADTLSRSLVADATSNEPPPFEVIAVLQVQDHAKGGEAGTDVIVADSTIAAEQCKNTELSELTCYLETRTLPPDEKKAPEFNLTKSQYTVVDGVLYFVEQDKSLRIIPPKACREKHFL